MYQNIYYDRRVNKMHVWDDKFGHQTFRYKKYAYTKSKVGTYISLYGDKLKRIKQEWGLVMARAKASNDNELYNIAAEAQREV